MTTTQADSGVSFLAKLLAACDNTDDPDYAGIKVAVICANGRKVAAKLVAPAGDVYLVTVEWLSEESP